MNYLRLLQGAAGGTLAVLAAVFLVGCQSPPEYLFANWDGASGVNGTNASSTGEGILREGELIRIEFFSSGSQPPIQPYEERIKEDGTITPPMIGSVTAAGKLTGELQKELQERYQRLFKHITVVVTAGVRVFWVDGEVHKPGAQTYLGPTDMMKAIAAAGGFTPYANKRRIHVIRPDGTVERANYNKAINNPSQNLTVNPGDKVWVPRRILW